MIYENPFLACAGVVDPKTRLAYSHRRHSHLHQRPALSITSRRWLRRVDAADHIAAAEGFGHIRGKTFPFVYRKANVPNWFCLLSFSSFRRLQCQVSTEPKISLAFRLSVIGKVKWLISYSNSLWLLLMINWKTLSSQKGASKSFPFGSLRKFSSTFEWRIH